MPSSYTPRHLPWRVSDAASKADKIANHCFYMIAMGGWLPGSKLPSVRQSETEWSVNRQTVLNAYRSLASRGLVYHKPNGGYYVADQGPKRDFARDRIEVQNLYEDMITKIRAETDLAPLGVLRVLARIAESQQSEKPDIAFVECSKSQAADHAREISERLRFPVLPLALDEIRGKKMRIPPNVRVVFTTSFHFDELRDLETSETEIVALPMEISADLLRELKGRGEQVVFLESDRDLAARTAKDAVWMMSVEGPRVEVAPDIGAFLEEHLGSADAGTSEVLFVVSQKEWEDLDPKWRTHASVRPVSCRLSEGAWPVVADALGIPFGSTM